MVNSVLPDGFYLVLRSTGQLRLELVIYTMYSAAQSMSSRSSMVLKRNLLSTSKQVSRSFATSGKTCSIFTNNSKRTTKIQPKKIVLQSNLFGSLAISIGALGIGLYCLDARSAVQEYVFCPLLRLATSAEDGHKLGIIFLKYGLAPRLFSDNDDEILQVDVFGKKLKNPVGMAAGFDKEGEAIDPVLDLGFSYIEIGSITPEPQPGNPKPRFFRLPQDDAVINRYGFNSSGHLSVLSTLRVRFEKLLSANPNATNNSFRDGKLLAINLGKNKTGDEIEDYVKGVQNFGPYADVLVINVSSPNTPGLRNLQSEAKLTNLLKTVVSERDNLPGELINPNLKPPVLVKIAPDLTEEEIKSISIAAKAAKIDGIIMSNTTVQRPVKKMITKSDVVRETGGLSGKPLKEISLRGLRTLRKYTKDSDLVLVGCGGISSGKDAIEFAKAGATFVELYTAFAYKGPGLAAKVKDEIVSELKKEGKTWMEIVGSDDK